jgi:transcription-repair coupling factor (superfamily II helicase)
MPRETIEVTSDSTNPTTQPYSEFTSHSCTLPASLLDYLPRQALLLVDNWEDLQNAALEVEEQSVGLRADLVKDGLLPNDFPIPYLTWTEIEDTLITHPLVELGPSSAPQNSYLAQRFSSGPRFGGRLKPLLDHLAERTTAGD